MTTVHPVPARWPADRQDQAPARFHSGAGASLLFFEPGADGLARHAESPGQTAQGTALFVSSQNLFALRFRVAVRLRVVPAAPATVVTEVSLLAVSGQAVPDNVFAAAVRAGNHLRNHRRRLPSLTRLNHYHRARRARSVNRSRGFSGRALSACPSLPNATNGGR